MIGVAIPAHNEEDVIVECLHGVFQAAQSHRLNGEGVMVVVVADSCTDATGKLAARAGATTLTVDARNVGMA